MSTVRMDLFMARLGSYRLGFSAQQVGWVAPYPSDLAWPSRDGQVGRVALPGTDAGIRVIDLLTYWQPDNSWAVRVQRVRPTVLLVLANGTTAVAVDSYALGTYSLLPASASLNHRGIYALATDGDDTFIVLDMSRVVAQQKGDKR